MFILVLLFALATSFQMSAITVINPTDSELTIELTESHYQPTDFLAFLYKHLKRYHNKYHHFVVPAHSLRKFDLKSSFPIMKFQIESKKTIGATTETRKDSRAAFPHDYITGKAEPVFTDEWGVLLTEKPEWKKLNIQFIDPRSVEEEAVVFHKTGRGQKSNK